MNSSSSRCHVLVCSLWLWYFLIILTYFLIPKSLSIILHRFIKYIIYYIVSYIPCIKLCFMSTLLSKLCRLCFQKICEFCCQCYIDFAVKTMLNLLSKAWRSAAKTVSNLVKLGSLFFNVINEENRNGWGDVFHLGAMNMAKWTSRMILNNRYKHSDLFVGLRKTVLTHGLHFSLTEYSIKIWIKNEKYHPINQKAEMDLSVDRCRKFNSA